MNIKDAKVLLTAVKEKQLNDELLIEYTKRDTLQKKLIVVKDSTIKTQSEVIQNSVVIVSNLNKINANQAKEIDIFKGTIKERDKEIKKQKVLKKIGFIGCVVLPFLTLLYATNGHF